MVCASGTRRRRALALISESYEATGQSTGGKVPPRVVPRTGLAGKGRAGSQRI